MKLNEMYTKLYNEFDYRHSAYRVSFQEETNEIFVEVPSEGNICKISDQGTRYRIEFYICNNDEDDRELNFSIHPSNEEEVLNLVLLLYDMAISF